MKRLWSSLISLRSFGAQVSLTMGTNALLALLGVATGVLTARLLGPQGRGELAAIQLWPTFFANVALLGLPEALIYYLASAPRHPGHYLGSAVALGGFASVVGMGLGYLFLPSLLLAQPSAVVASARWYLLFLPLTTLTEIPRQALRGYGDFTLWNALRLAPGLGWLAILCVAWAFAYTDPGMMAMGYLVVLVGVSVLIIYTVTRRTPEPLWVSPMQWPAMLRYGLPSLAGNVPQWLNLYLGQMVIAATLPVERLGLYVVAYTWSSIVPPLLYSLGVVFFPRIASQPNLVQRVQVFTQGSRMAVFAAGIVTVMVLLCTPWVLVLFCGQAFAEVVPTALVLVLAAAVMGINLVLEEGLRGLGKPELILGAEFGGLVVTVGMLVLLLHPLDIMGAAVASGLGCSTVTGLLVLRIRRHIGFPLSSFLCPTYQDMQLSWQHGKVLIAGVLSR